MRNTQKPLTVEDVTRALYFRRVADNVFHSDPLPLFLANRKFKCPDCGSLVRFRDDRNHFKICWAEWLNNSLKEQGL